MGGMCDGGREGKEWKACTIGEQEGMERMCDRGREGMERCVIGLGKEWNGYIREGKEWNGCVMGEGKDDGGIAGKE